MFKLLQLPLAFASSQGCTMTNVTNIDSLNALMGLTQANKTISQASQRLSTGLRVNSVADDVGGLAVANDLKTQISSYNSVLTNLAEGSAVTQTVDSALTEIVDILDYMRVAAVSAESDTITAAERTAYTSAITAYVTAISNISTNATWNGTSLMSTASTMDIQTGVNSGNSTTISFKKITTASASLAIDSLSLTTAENAVLAVASIDAALATVNTYQTYINAMSNVMDSQYNVASDTVMNYSAAYGNIMNADYAAETAKLAAAQIQRDGAAAMMLQSTNLDRSLVDYLLKSVSN